LLLTNGLRSVFPRTIPVYTEKARIAASNANLNIVIRWKNETTISKIGSMLRIKYMNGNSLKARRLTFAVPACRKKRSGSFPMPIVQVLQK